MTTTNVFYADGRIVDVAVSRVRDVDGKEFDLEVPIGKYSRKNIEQLKAESATDIVLLSVEEAVKRVEDAWVSQPIVITESEWYEALGCMPPLNRQGSEDTESFRMSEAYTASVHATYVRIGQRYFCWRERLSTPHSELLATVKAAFN